MRTVFKKHFLTVLLLQFTLFLFSMRAYGAEEVIYRSVEKTQATEEKGDARISGVVETPAGVTEEMGEYGYWCDKNKGSGIGIDEVLISENGIRDLNRIMLEGETGKMYDLAGLNESYDAGALRDQLKDPAIPNKPAIYADGELIGDCQAYYGAIGKAIEETGYTGVSSNQYALAVRRTTMLSLPTSHYIGYSETDTDNEIVSSALNVNEPFVIRQMATVSGNTFYWGYSDICTGWVDSKDLAICASKDEWLDAWKTEPGDSDLLVVTENCITLEPSYYQENISEVKLTFATILKLVPEKEIPRSVGERGPWNNYVVYLPTRDDSGKYVKSIALISQHYDVSTGFPEMTQSEILRVAFNNLGDRYGWGGMLDSMDCSLFTRNVYKCFGLFLPRNTNWQLTPERLISLSDMSDEDKLYAIRKMPAGTCLYFSGHTMIYTGTVDNMGYVISDTGSVSDSDGEVDIRSMYSIILSPLSVRRRNGSTWLSNLHSAVLPISGEYFALVSENLAEKGPEEGEKTPSENSAEKENGEEKTPSENGIRKVPVMSGQSYPASSDTLPLDTFLGNIKNLFISFANVEGAGVEKLSVTCIKGSKITTKEKADSVECDKKTAGIRYDKVSGTAVLSMKSSGTVTFNMADGKKYTVEFTVEKPKPRKAEVKELLSKNSEGNLSLGVYDLFGTNIDSGSLQIVKDIGGAASLSGNTIVLDREKKTPVKVRYDYLNKKYSIKLK